MNARHALRAVAAAAVLALASAPVPDAGAQALPGTPRGSQTGDSGGAYTGLASSPDANLFTGIAQTSIPIEVPPGRLGLAPVLALSYSSNAGPGPYGYGWNLPLPRVHRSTRLGVPRYDDVDEYVLEMPGATTELERIPGSARGFRARVEGTFPRIGFHDAENSWKVVDKLGVTFVFGASAATRSGRGPSRPQTFAWLLERIEDAAGNRIEFRYRGGGAAGTSSGLPERILYGANSRTGSPHFAEVAFEWSPHNRSAAPMVSWRSGYAEPLDVRLQAIETFTHGLRARRYDFSHEEVDVTADLRLAGVTLTAFAADPDDDVTLPSTVFVYAPALASGWPAIGSTSALKNSFEVPNAGPLRLGDSNVTADSVDLNGDAIVDRIDSGLRPPRVMIGDGRSFGPLRPWNWPVAAAAPKAVRRSDGKGNLLSNVFDLDGDGFADLVDSSPLACGAVTGTWCVWRGSADGFATAPVRWSSPSPLLRSTLDGGAKIVSDLVDLDADGRLDLVDATPFDELTGARYWHVHPNTGTSFDATPRRFAAPVAWLARSVGPRLAYGLFDLNADALPDLVSADPDYGGGNPRWDGLAAWKVHLNHGNGFAPEPESWPIDAGGVSSLPNFVNLHATDGSSIADLFDLTGDGRPDLVRRWRVTDALGPDAEETCVPTSRCAIPEATDPATTRGFCCYDLLVYANTGSSFAQPVGWSSPAHGLRSDHDSCPFGNSLECNIGYTFDFDFFDVDGDGLVEFVERYTAAGKPGSWLVHPHPSGAPGGGTRPNLLLAMRNGVGGETMLRYSTAASTRDTRLPFPHWVVRERELRDSVFDGPPLRTSYAYRGGLFDAVDREMRGFAVVQEVDPVGVSTVSEYHQDRRRAGRLLRTTTLAPPSCTAAHPEDPADPCSPWNAPLGQRQYEWPESGPVLLRQETDVPMHAGAAVENLRVTTSHEYDAYGNVTRRRTETPLAAATTTTTEYEYRVGDRPGGMPDRYLVAKPSHVVTREDGRELPLVERTFEYEGASGIPGALSIASTCVDQAGSGCTRWSRRSFAYDTAGNVVLARGPDGATSRTGYDAHALFAIRSVDPVGLVTTSTTDPRNGRVTETVAPNGSRVHSRHDGLGRLLRTWGPGTAEESPLLRVDYAPGNLGGSMPRARTVDAARGASTAFFDGLGRAVATKTAATSAGRAVTRISGLRRRDARGLVIAEALPFDSDDLDLATLSEQFTDAPARLEFEYDATGRLLATRAPDGSVRRVDSSAPGILRRDDANATDGVWPGAVTLELFDGLSRRLLREVCSAAPTAASPYECPAGSLLRREGWTWDGLGRPEEMRTFGLGVAAGDAKTTIARDGLGNPVLVDSTNAGSWRYRNDENGRVIEVEKPDGTRIVSSYDAAGRLVGRRGPVTRSTYRYHTAGGGIGKLRRTTTRTRTSRISEEKRYDDRGRVMERQRRIGIRGERAAEMTLAYGYDEFDRRVSTSYEPRDGTGDTLHVDHDDEGRELAVRSDAVLFATAVSRDSQGRLLRTDYGNGVTDLVSWEAADNAGRKAGYLRCARTTATALDNVDACGATPADLEARRYTRYDPNGNLLAADDLRYPTGDARHENLRYAYDSLGRLRSAGATAGAKEHFLFDPLGNLLLHDDLTLDYPDPANPSRIAFVREATGPVQAVTYDASGRRRTDTDREYLYDDADRLLTVLREGQPEAEYAYLDHGERAFSRDLRSGRVLFEFGDGIRLDGDTLERTIVFEGRPIAVERRALRAAAAEAVRRVFLHSDHQQTVRVITDETGRAIEHDRYFAFGARRARLDGDGRRIDDAATRYGYTGHVHDETDLMFFGARHYDPRTGAFLTLDPDLQFASPYAYSGGNPIGGRDADGRIFALTAMELLTIAAGTATFIDSIVRTGDLGHSLTAGVFAGFSVAMSGQLSTAVARPLAQVGHPWLQMAASVATDGFQAIEAAEAIEDGRYVGGVMAAGMLAASLIGIETASDPGPGASPEENYARHGIKDRGMADGRRTIDVNGICSTRPGCFSNILVAARENLRVLFGGQAACVGGCGHVSAITRESLGKGEDVLLRCNSFGAIKCLGAIGDGSFAANLSASASSAAPRLSVEMSGAPLLRPPRIEGLTYQVNLFDPVVWVGTGYSAALRSDVVLGRNWWVPTPLIVHHSQMYEKPFHEALGEMLR